MGETMSIVYFTLFPLLPGLVLLWTLVNFFNLFLASGDTIIYIISIKRLTMFKGEHNEERYRNYTCGSGNR